MSKRVMGGGAAPLACYWFFVGDGSISKGRYDIQLSSDNFSSACLARLKDLFAAIQIRCGITSSNRILIKAVDVPRFYRFIGPCRNPEYAYKWDYEAPKWTFARVAPKGVKQ